MDEQFKRQLAVEIMRLSTAFSPDMKPIDKNILTQMVNMICEQIIRTKLSSNILIYKRIIDKIISGEIRIYQFNVVNLMQAFQTQKDYIYG